jgi:NAD(P)-dependent dehydrogenase (short-subunit alcohol dehydrogenase family)
MQIERATVLLTGANRGIGRSLALALRDAGAEKIYVGARRPAALEPLIALDPKRFVPVEIDVTDQSLVEALAAKARDVNVLINNAGVIAFGSILDVPLATIEDTFRTNVYGSLLMARAFVPVIEKNGGGAIVNILSLLALASMPSVAAYSASKTAAWSMTQSLRAAVSSKGIAVHAVFPSSVDTDMVRGVDIAKATPTEVAAAVVAGVAEGREDIFPDAISAKLYAAWTQDHKKLERRFAGM